MKFIIIIILLIILVILVIVLIIKTLTLKEILAFAINYFNINIKIKNKKNLDKFNKTNKVIIMANHINGLDYGIIHSIINSIIDSNKKIYAVAKHNAFGDKTDANIISNILGLFKNNTYKFFKLIPYVRGNKDSGNEVKQNMLEVINNGDTVLLFPEGETTRSGIPVSFKPGSFKLCAENNISILPITIKYDKKIGVNRTDPIDINKWHNVTATAIVHPMIINTDPDQLQEQVFQTIRKPLLISP